MAEYAAPIRDMQFVLNELVGLEKVAQLPGCEETTTDLVNQILEEAGRFASEVLSPLKDIDGEQQTENHGQYHCTESCYSV